MKTLLLSILTVALLTFISCEGGTTFTKHIENNSSETITIQLFQLDIDNQDSYVIAPGENQVVFFQDILGLFVGKAYDCLSELDSISVSVSNNKSLIKDIMLDENWQSESMGGRNSKEKCTFQITDEDLN